MDRKPYFQPAQHIVLADPDSSVFDVVASEEKIDDGGIGNNNDDPDAKSRDFDADDTWGTLW